jgi:small subunit ribosomal protein S2
MRRLPNLLFVVDIRRDALAIKEANILGIPIIAMVDTNCDPDPVDHVIPSNDDAIRALKLINSTMATAVLEGQAILSSLRAEEEEVDSMEADEAMERYLGPSTLAYIQAAEAEAAVEVVESVEDMVETEVGEVSAEVAERETDVTGQDKEEVAAPTEEAVAETIVEAVEATEEEVNESVEAVEEEEERVETVES